MLRTTCEFWTGGRASSLGRDLLLVSVLACMGTVRARAGESAAGGNPPIFAIDGTVTCVEPDPSSAKHARSPAVSFDGQAEAPVDSGAERAVAEINADLLKISENFGPLFDDPWMKYATRAYGGAEQHAKSLVWNGQPVFRKAVEFHNELDEFIRALESMPSWNSGTIGQNAELAGKPKPDERQIKRLLNAVMAVKKKANETPGLEDLASRAFTKDTPAAYAVEYGILTTERIRGVLWRRGLGPITGDGSARTHEVMVPALDRLVAALNALVGPDGERVVQVDDNGRPLGDQLKPAKQCIEEAQNAVATLKKILPWADAKYGGPSRIEVSREDLKRLAANLVKPSALREVPKIAEEEEPAQKNSDADSRR